MVHVIIHYHFLSRIVETDQPHCRSAADQLQILPQMPAEDEGNEESGRLPCQRMSLRIGERTALTVWCLDDYWGHDPQLHLLQERS